MPRHASLRTAGRHAPLAVVDGEISRRDGCAVDQSLELVGQAAWVRGVDYRAVWPLPVQHRERVALHSAFRDDVTARVDVIWTPAV